MSGFNAPYSKVSQVTIDITTADLAGANRGQRPDLIAGAYTYRVMPGGSLYQSDGTQLVDADLLVYSQDGVVRANVIVRSGTRAALMAVVDGTGELATSTDTPAIFWLRPMALGGPLEFQPVGPGSFLEVGGIVTTSIQPNTVGFGQAGESIVIQGGEADNLRGGDITIRGGATQTGTTGGVYVYAPTGLAAVTVSDGGLSFNDGTPANKPAVTGSRGGNAALTSLLTQLASMGLITNSTT